MAAAGSLTHPTKRVGRPVDPRGRLSEVINYRLTKEEADSLCRAALRMGISVNSYVREVVRRAMASEGFVGK